MTRLITHLSLLPNFFLQTAFLLPDLSGLRYPTNIHIFSPRPLLGHTSHMLPTPSLSSTFNLAGDVLLKTPVPTNFWLYDKTA